MIAIAAETILATPTLCEGDGQRRRPADGLGSIAGHILPVLRPQLTGLIAHHVDDLIDNPSTPNDRREGVVLGRRGANHEETPRPKDSTHQAFRQGLRRVGRRPKGQLPTRKKNVWTRAL